jgi:hypothetical protein
MYKVRFMVKYAAVVVEENPSLQTKTAPVSVLKIHFFHANSALLPDKHDFHFSSFNYF